MCIINSSFRAVFNCSYRADREEGKFNYRFPSIVINNGKERAWNFQKWEGKNG